MKIKCAKLCVGRLTDHNRRTIVYIISEVPIAPPSSRREGGTRSETDGGVGSGVWRKITEENLGVKVFAKIKMTPLQGHRNVRIGPKYPQTCQ